MDKYEEAIAELRAEKGTRYEEIGDLFQGLLTQLAYERELAKTPRRDTEHENAARSWFYRNYYSPRF